MQFVAVSGQLGANQSLRPPHWIVDAWRPSFCRLYRVSDPPLQHPHYVAARETRANKTIAIHLADVSGLIAYGGNLRDGGLEPLLCIRRCTEAVTGILPNVRREEQGWELTSSSRRSTTTVPLRFSRTRSTGFIQSGTASAMGAHGVQQLRMTAIELQLAPVRSSVHIPVATQLEAFAKTMIDDLLWWTEALKAARTIAS